MSTRNTRNSQIGRGNNTGGRGGGGAGLREAMSQSGVKMTVLTNKKETKAANESKKNKKEKEKLKSTNVKEKNKIKPSEEKGKDVDFNLIDAISEEYINNTETWNDPIKVEQKMIDLECEITSVTDKETRENIQKIIDAYQHRHKQLTIENGPKREHVEEVETEKGTEPEEKTPVQGETYKIDDEGKIEIIDSPETREKELKVFAELEEGSDVGSVASKTERKETKTMGEETPKRKINTKKGSGNSSKKKQSRLITPTRDIRTCIKPIELWKHTNDDNPTPAEAGAMLINVGKEKSSEKKPKMRKKDTVKHSREKEINNKRENQWKMTMERSERMKLEYRLLTNSL